MCRITRVCHPHPTGPDLRPLTQIGRKGVTLTLEPVRGRERDPEPWGDVFPTKSGHVRVVVRGTTGNSLEFAKRRGHRGTITY